MRYPAGPHKRAGRRRRRCKALIIAGVLVMLLLAATVHAWTPPPEAAGPSEQELAVARNLYQISGDNGFAHIYLEQWPAWAAYIRGEAP